MSDSEKSTNLPEPKHPLNGKTLREENGRTNEEVSQPKIDPSVRARVVPIPPKPPEMPEKK
jgi:hypothetical protein